MQTQNTDVRILSYNFFLRPYFVKTNADDYKQERLDEFATIMGRYDIICFQEAFDNFSHRQFQLIKYAGDAGFNYVIRSPSPPLTGKHLIDGGLVIVSKYPIESTEFYMFKRSIFSDSLTQKGVLYAKIGLPKGILHIFTTHDQAHYQNPDKVIEMANHYIRLRQLVEAKNFINRKLAMVMEPNDSAMFLGDLNVDANWSTYPLKEAQVLFSHEFLPPAYRELTNNEYDLLLHILSNPGVKFPCKDVFYNQHEKFLVTYGDVFVDANGVEKPLVS